MTGRSEKLGERDGAPVLTVSSDACTTTPRQIDPPLHKVFSYATPSERRQRRLKRGIRRWWQDTTEAVVGKEVFLGEIDFPGDKPEQTFGEIERFWRAFRAAYGPRRYFWWIELQRRGMPHYHFVLVDPPWRLEREWRRFYAEVFVGHRHQPRPYWRTWDWFVANQGAYAMKYAYKMAGARVAKAYQQAYDILPSQLRTFGANLLTFLVDELDQHRNRFDGSAVNIWDEIKLGVIDWWCDRLLVHGRSSSGCGPWMKRRRHRLRGDRPASPGGSIGAPAGAPG